ncbi:MAG: peptide-methionine (S)-S-oxide reductase MsrA [Acidobacteriaceae bacterium]|nr:peptide-methionine (S)-S-oxide reductase MsrA [Acidobacteriaceae bacterium]MBV9500404.1 peptide-methionine (S)-S-oxide reductase MsrA [Acidobacteriaceae bacterium]
MSKRSFIFLLPVLVAGAFCAFAKSRAPFPEPAVDVPVAEAHGEQTAVLAGGCFWGMEGVFERVIGVTNVVSGFAGGQKSTAHYEEVSTGRTGHAESVKITFDPTKITYGQLLRIYFSVAHDPTQKDHQGPDWGTQYRSAIFYDGDDQKRVAEAYIKQLTDAHVFSHRIVTQVVPLTGFYAAEAYHQHFLDNNMTYPYIVYNDLPKIAALKKDYPELCKRQ